MLIPTSSSQSQFIKQAVSLNMRVDGRTNSTQRQPIIKTNVLPHIPASSYVYLQYQDLQIYTGIKVKLVGNQLNQQCKADDKIHLEIASMHKVNEQEQQIISNIESLLLSKYLYNLLEQNSLLTNTLRIPNSKKYHLVMYIDVFLLSTPHMTSLEYIHTGIRSALQSLHLYEFRVTYNEVTEEETIELTNTELDVKQEKIDDSKILVIGVLDNQYYVADMSKEEYQSMDACFMVVVREDRVKHIEILKGKCTIECLHKIAKFVVSITERE